MTCSSSHLPFEILSAHWFLGSLISSERSNLWPLKIKFEFFKRYFHRAKFDPLDRRSRARKHRFTAHINHFAHPRASHSFHRKVEKRDQFSWATLIKLWVFSSFSWRFRMNLRVIPVFGFSFQSKKMKAFENFISSSEWRREFWARRFIVFNSSK